jgi:hypothetical protein
LRRAEARGGRTIVAFAVAGLLMVLSGIYVRPAIRTVALGQDYAAMASHPFDHARGTTVGYRVLTPLVSHLLGLSGERIIITNLLLATVLLALAYVYFRQSSRHPVDAVLAASTLAISLVTLTTIYYGGYTDSMTYVLLFLMYLFRRRPALFFALLLLNLMNRESVLFLVPWFLFVSAGERTSRKRWLAESAIGYGLVLAAVSLFRHVLAGIRPIEFGAAYYLQPLIHNPFFWFRRSFTCQEIGFLSVFKFSWFFVAFAVSSLWARGRWREVVSLGLLTACCGLQLLVAIDSSRLWTMSFPMMIIALQHLLAVHPRPFRRWAPAVLLANLWLPQMFTAGHLIEIMRSTPVCLLLTWLKHERW